MDFTFEGASLGFLFQYLYSAVAALSILVPLFYLRNKKHLSSHLFVWFLSGLVFNLFSLSWLYTAYPILWAPSDHQLLLIGTLHFLMASIAALGFLVVGLVSHRAKNVREIFFPLLLGVGFFFAEILRSVFLSILFYKEGAATIGLHWSSGLFGNALGVTPLVELAHYGGAYTLSAVLVIILASLFTRNKKVITLYCGAIFIIWLCIHFFVPVYMPKDGKTLAIASLSVPDLREEKDSTFYKKQQHFLFTKIQENKAPSSLVVLPEDARFIQYTSKEEKRALVRKGVEVVVEGGTTIHNQALSNYSYAYDTANDVTLGRGKWFMFPFNEYVPSLFSWLTSLIFKPEDVAAYENNHSYKAGKLPQVFATSFGNIGTLLCSEMFSYDSIEALRGNGASLIALQSHLPVFHKNPWLFMSYYLVAQEIAAQTRVLLVVSAADAPSLVVSPYGKILFTGPVENSLTSYRVDRGQVLQVR